MQRADGTVPWVDEQISTADLFGPPRAPRTAAAGSKPCRAAQLTAVLTGWKRPSYGSEKPRGFDTAIGHLIGEVDIGNTSASECTLRGEVPIRMIAGGREVPMLYTHGINDEARRRLTVVPAGGHASLRLDWSGPFCQPLEGALELAIELPDHGGTLRGPITATDTPGCARGEGVNPNARATLSASGFSEPAEPAPPQDSPLGGTTVALSGPDTAAPGTRLPASARVPSSGVSSESGFGSGAGS